MKNKKGIRKVVISEHGYQKYVMIRINRSGVAEVVIRTGNIDLPHWRIVEKFRGEIKPGDKIEVMGGGFITLSERSSQIDITGTSKKYGTADHEFAQRIFRAEFPGFRIIAL